MKDLKSDAFNGIRIEISEKNFPDVKNWLMNDEIRIEGVGRVKHIGETGGYDMPVAAGTADKKPKKEKKYIYVSLELRKMDAKKSSGGVNAGEIFAGRK